MARRWWQLLCAIAVAADLSARGAFAEAREGEQATTSPSAAAAATSDGPLPDDGKPRPRPDYRGRVEPRPWSDSVIWIPRALLAPAYVASDMTARPIAALAIYAERYHWRVRLYDFFTFGVEDQVGVFPTGRVDLGFRPSAGVSFFWKNIWRSSDIRVPVRQRAFCSRAAARG